ncbi:MAG: peptidase S8 [Stigonema ocellatum SAG 48.90 = DSM 106950]|nr:peptidase S8 [Stigonema ocellatum SAG 48.90 = DSM 106950]
MPINYTSNIFASNQGLNVNPISSKDDFNLNPDYSLGLSGRSSFNPIVYNWNPQLSVTSGSTSGSYNSTSGYGLVNAAAAVAKAAGQNTFADVPTLGGNNWAADLIKAPEVWAKGYTGKNVVVAVLDTGVDYTHPELKDNIWTNPNPGNGNDIHGWNFVDNNNNVLDTSQIGHGTHVAGTIAGENNGLGVTGIAYDAKIMPVKVLDNSGSGSYTSIINGIHYAADHGANVINLSLGGSYPYSSLESAIKYASSKGVIVVMAAGNDSAAAPGYPARYAQNWGLAVGAVDQNKSMAYFSNQSGSNPLAYVTAPGVNIYSTLPGNKYTTYSGTSMATPHVAGLVALMLSANHNLTDSQVRQIITGTAQSTTQAATKTASFASTSFNTQLITNNITQTSSFSTSSIIDPVISSTSWSENNNMLVNPSLWSQFVSNYQNALDDSNSKYNISIDTPMPKGDGIL